MDRMELEEIKFIKSAEKTVAEIREKALKEVQKTNPEIEYVIDKYSVDDYWDRRWDYPGRWFYGIIYPPGIRSEQEAVATVVKETLEYFGNKN